MSKKRFGLAIVTTLSGLVAAATALAACSAVLGIADYSDRVADEGGEGGDATVRADGALDGSVDDASNADATGSDAAADTGADAEGGTEVPGSVGQPCNSTTDCTKSGSINTMTTCAKAVFQEGDLFASPVCIQAMCTQGNTGTVDDLLCNGKQGTCLPTAGSLTVGICLPFCAFTSTFVTDKCAGGNKCWYLSPYTDPMSKVTSGIGFCFGGCTVDADCTGTAGEKCQAEDGLCVNPDRLLTYTATGTSCTRPAGVNPATCNCVFVGNHADGTVSASADKGLCTHACITGTAGDVVCNTAKAGWTCTAKLPLVNDGGVPLFTSQPTDITGTCAQPCNVDGDCTALASASGLSGLMRCKAYADGKYCSPSPD